VTVAEVGVLEPQSNVLFFLLMVMFAALAWWMVRTRRLAVRLLAGAWPSCPRWSFGGDGRQPVLRLLLHLGFGDG
jgi:hypothetical protein